MLVTSRAVLRAYEEYDVAIPPLLLPERGSVLAIEREIGYLLGVIRSLHRLGEVACDLGEFAEARRRFVEALSITRQLRDPMNTAAAFEAVASLAAAERHDLTAMRLVGAADAIRTAVGSRLDPAAQNRLEQRLAPAGARLGERPRPVQRAPRSRGKRRTTKRRRFSSAASTTTGVSTQR